MSQKRMHLSLYSVISYTAVLIICLNTTVHSEVMFSHSVFDNLRIRLNTELTILITEPLTESYWTN